MVDRQHSPGAGRKLVTAAAVTKAQVGVAASLETLAELREDQAFISALEILGFVTGEYRGLEVAIFNHAHEPAFARLALRQLAAAAIFALTSYEEGA